MADVKQRWLKLKWIERMLSSYYSKDRNEPISKKKLIAAFCVTFKSTDRTAKECLNILANLGAISIDGDSVKVVDLKALERIFDLGSGKSKEKED